MIASLLRFELNYHRKQVVFWLSAFILAWMASLLTSQAGSPVDFANSAFSINRIIAMLSMQIIFVSAVLTAATALRDSQHAFEPLVFATPIDKFQYLAARFIGIVIATTAVFLISLIAMMLTPLTLESNIVAPFDLSHYLYGLAVFLLPNILLCCSIVFAGAMLSKNLLVVYTSAIVLFVIYGVGAVLGNSPIAANSSALLHEGFGLASLIDPYGGMAFFEQTTSWTSAERNTRLPTLSGNLLFNRLIWITVALSLFAMTYRLFSFRSASQKVTKKLEVEPAMTTISKYQAVKQQLDFSRLNLQVFWSKLSIEYRCVVKGKPFIVLMLATATLIAVEVMGSILNGPISGAPAFYPLTELILELIQDPLDKLGKLIAIYYAVELYWNERTANIHHLTDATPTQNLTFYLAKLATVVAICFTIITVSIITAIIFQFSQGHFDIKPSLYLILYLYAGFPLMLTAIITLFLQRFAKNRATGLIAGVVVFAVPMLVRVAGLGHPLTLFAFNPDFVFSDMTNSLYHAHAFNWFSLYWAGFCGILAVLTIKSLRRGYANTKTALSSGNRNALVAFTLVFVGSGAYNFYQVNVFNQFSSRDSRLDTFAAYEKSYTQYQDVAYPTVTDVNVAVDIFPEKNQYVAKGQYIIENQSASPMSEMLVGVLKKPRIEHKITIEGAKLTRYDEVHQKYFFELEQPLKPGQTTVLNFELDAIHNAFTRLDPEHYVTAQGSYFELEDVLPQFGFNYRYVITDEQEREKRNLSGMGIDLPESDMQHQSDDWVQFETTVSTTLAQTAVTPGDLQKSWVENDRRYFHYKTDQKIARNFAYTSAEFDIAKYHHNGVDIEIFHSPQHNNDNEHIADALRKSMDFFDQNFTPYSFKTYKVVEIPYFSSRQSFGTAIPGMYLGVENRFFNLDIRGIEHNPQLRGVTHEYSHQYWGGYLQPQGIAGARMISETLAKYSELLLAMHTEGVAHGIDEVFDAVNSYLRLRSINNEIEPPLYQVTMQPHVFYFKGKQAMHALRDILGEEKLNQALRTMLSEFAYPKRPTSLDLLNAYYDVARPQDIPLIDDMFKRVVFHDLKLNSATSKALNEGGFEITVDVTTLKSVVNPDTGKEAYETINDNLEIAFYAKDKQTGEKHLLQTQRVKFSQDNSTITIKTKTKPDTIVIDPNYYRIDRNVENNRIELE